MLRKIFFLFLLVMAFSSRLHAQSVDCSKAVTQLEMNECAQRQYSAADKELNTIYNKLLKVLPADQKAILISSQRKWIVFRDEYAKIYEKMYEGGSIVPLVFYNCKTETTLSRVKQLKALYDEEGR